MDIEQMRKKISLVYSNKTWETRVKNMGPNQILAVYHRFLKDGRFKGSKAAKSSKPSKLEGFKPTQIIFDEYIMGLDLASGPNTTVINGEIKNTKEEENNE